MLNRGRGWRLSIECHINFPSKLNKMFAPVDIANTCSCFRSTRLFALMERFRKASRIDLTLGFSFLVPHPSQACFARDFAHRLRSLTLLCSCRNEQKPACRLWYNLACAFFKFILCIIFVMSIVCKLAFNSSW